MSLHRREPHIIGAWPLNETVGDIVFADNGFFATVGFDPFSGHLPRLYSLTPSGFTSLLESDHVLNSFSICAGPNEELLGLNWSVVEGEVYLHSLADSGHSSFSTETLHDLILRATANDPTCVPGHCQDFLDLTRWIEKQLSTRDSLVDVTVDVLQPGYIRVTHYPDGRFAQTKARPVASIWHLDSATGSTVLLYLFSGRLKAAMTRGPQPYTVLLSGDCLMVARRGEPMRELAREYSYTPTLSELALATANTQLRTALEIARGTVSAGPEIDTVYVCWTLRPQAPERNAYPSLKHRTIGVLQLVRIASGTGMVESCCVTEHGLNPNLATADASQCYAVDDSCELIRILPARNFVERMGFSHIDKMWEFSQQQRFAVQQRDGMFTYFAM